MRVLAAGREIDRWQDQKERRSSSSGSLRNTACQETTRETAKDSKSLALFSGILSMHAARLCTALPGLKLIAAAVTLQASDVLSGIARPLMGSTVGQHGKGCCQGRLSISCNPAAKPQPCTILCQSSHD